MTMQSRSSCATARVRRGTAYRGDVNVFVLEELTNTFPLSLVIFHDEHVAHTLRKLRFEPLRASASCSRFTGSWRSQQHPSRVLPGVVGDRHDVYRDMSLCGLRLSWSNTPSPELSADSCRAESLLADSSNCCERIVGGVRNDALETLLAGHVPQDGGKRRVVLDDEDQRESALICCESSRRGFARCWCRCTDRTRWHDCAGGVGLTRGATSAGMPGADQGECTSPSRCAVSR